MQSTPQSGKVTWNEVIAFVNPNAALQLLDAASVTRRVSSKNQPGETIVILFPDYITENIANESNQYKT